MYVDWLSPGTHSIQGQPETASDEIRQEKEQASWRLQYWSSCLIRQARRRA